MAPPSVKFFSCSSHSHAVRTVRYPMLRECFRKRGGHVPPHCKIY
ncbi:Uncharacterized protein dnm_057500 [Desulfonema magnum]|uniref:Uncharacterized protein n=1 Tax=Desulfonema magnum TaxID=45655 RepID=A0A975BQC9_9BACT|nr:Uncharacterized protein dnm_057500 [Desulfonema magnum]